MNYGNSNFNFKIYFKINNDEILANNRELFLYVSVIPATSFPFSRMRARFEKLRVSTLSGDTYESRRVDMILRES